MSIASWWSGESRANSAVAWARQPREGEWLSTARRRFSFSRVTETTTRSVSPPSTTSGASKAMRLISTRSVSQIRSAVS